VLAVRDAVNKQLEEARNAGVMKGSLQAEVDLYCGSELKELLDSLQDELRFALITSTARVHALQEVGNATEMSDLRIVVNASNHAKCTRCWHHREDVGQYPEHPELCGRCVDNVAGVGETRRFA
jgi:isoleucyl-tRNA synthetase